MGTTNQNGDVWDSNGIELRLFYMGVLQWANIHVYSLCGQLASSMPISNWGCFFLGNIGVFPHSMFCLVFFETKPPFLNHFPISCTPQRYRWQNRRWRKCCWEPPVFWSSSMHWQCLGLPKALCLGYPLVTRPGKLTVCYWKWPFIVFPSKIVIFHSYVSLPEGSRG